MPPPLQAPLVALAAAVVQDLNAHADQFSLPFTAVRGFVPRYPLTDLATRRVVVVPGGTTTADADRGHLEDRHRLLIGCLKLLSTAGSDNRSDAGDLSELDAELAFVFEIRRFFLPDDQSVYALETPCVQVVSVTNDPAYDHDDLRDRREFRSIVAVEFLEVRP